MTKEKVRVWVKVSHQVAYIIEVEDMNDPEEIRSALEEKDPGEWESDPNFYEALGSNWRGYIEAMTDEEIQNLEHPIDG